MAGVADEGETHGEVVWAGVGGFKTVNPKFSQFGEVIVLDGSVAHAALPKETKVITSLLEEAELARGQQ